MTAVDASPLLDLPLAHDDDVRRYRQSAQGPAQPHGLPVRVADRRLDHEEIEIAAVVGVPARVRAEQHDPGARPGGRGQAPPCLRYDLLRDHRTDGT